MSLASDEVTQTLCRRKWTADYTNPPTHEATSCQGAVGQGNIGRGYSALLCRGPGLHLLEIINLDQRDTDAAILAGHDRRELARRREGDKDTRFVRMRQREPVGRELGC